MRTKNGNFAVGILITVVIIILGGLFVVWQMGFFKGKKQDLDTTTSKVDSSIGSIAAFDLEVYDGKTLKGKDLVTLIEEVVEKGPELSIAVQTLVNVKKATPVTIYYNKALTTANAINPSGTVTVLDQSSKSSDNYITPNAVFKGEVLKNSNLEITGIRFVQQK